MRNIIILSLILISTISNAQTRKDTIHLKDGSQILCQILNISEPDSIIQFCIRENGELTVKKVQTSFVDSYSWPGKNQAVKYSRMLGVKNIQSGEAYKGYWLASTPEPKQTGSSTDPIAIEIKKAKTLATISFATIGAGLVTAVVVPNLMKSPTMHGNNINSLVADLQKQGHTSQVCRRVGFSVAAVGAVIGILSLNHLTVANNLKMEARTGISLSVTSDGLRLAYKF
jgi:hypothetical protein